MENENAFKNLICASVVKKISQEISSVYPTFNHKKFQKLIPHLEALELKARVLLITEYLKSELPANYLNALSILVKVMKKNQLKGFDLWPFSEYISQFGLDHFDESMKAMYVLTSRFTSEFAVRPYLIKNHVRVLKYFSEWATDKDVHIRRWVSEGSRPLLPWGQQIPLFVMDPTHTILLLDKLRYDEELYVRKSVANHLNDISKNHPQVVIEVLRMWQKDVSQEHAGKIKWITRHALRTLIKKGNESALKLMGVNGKAEVKLVDFKLSKKKFRLNDELLFSFNIQSISKKHQKLIVDYSIDFIKANGKSGKKVFKLKTLQISPNENLVIKKKHSLKPITTMKFYAGTHQLRIHINGEIKSEIAFEFLP
jgi:3-methyladenine DNA glycosylase AlkC